ncbi:MAG: aminotransferase class I/II-fold pyridoxal phosphate-dependent enzyme [Alphaproteobacteria bacterium]|nr:aminotransferase class I/II-fold pyridoxal phosphate-dependent enzyme [Alphaproteobacteria bacterium]MDE2113109.1 aminotransferase class I/II-fold pyridoxal phosphate-dependent enzyme [Alphaproteobacteria bacterium]MDE2495229.1 aminotransferase class I/II-fold pyridoxal phosphate-dependent enzyme [Alphaproteobacteria bacterium]
MIPLARRSVGDPSLQRPDWTKGDVRDPALLWLDKNENRDPAQLALVARVVSELAPVFLSTYPHSAQLYAKLGKMCGVDPHCVVIAAGSDGVIRSVFEAYVSPGDTVIITAPSFAMYSVYSLMYGARMVGLEYQPSDGGPMLRSADVIAAIRRELPRVVCLPNPDSPCGTVFPEDELRSIIASAGDVGALILIDEAYYPFHDKTVVPWITEYPHLAVARTAAKAWGMSGLRIGWGISSPAVTAMMHKVRPMYECSTIAMAALEVMIDHEDTSRASVARLEAGKKVFLDAMEELGLRVLRGKGNFMHVAFGAHAEAVHTRLSTLCYYRRDFKEPCLKGFSRFSSTTAELFQPIIKAISEVVRT